VREEEEEDRSHGIVWLRYSEVGLFSQPDDLSQAKLGTFYQVLDAASGLEVRCISSNRVARLACLKNHRSALLQLQEVRANLYSPHLPCTANATCGCHNHGCATLGIIQTGATCSNLLSLLLAFVAHGAPAACLLSNYRAKETNSTRS
jgi:hypothetical protein